MANIINIGHKQLFGPKGFSVIMMPFEVLGQKLECAFAIDGLGSKNSAKIHSSRILSESNSHRHSLPYFFPAVLMRPVV